MSEIKIESGIPVPPIAKITGRPRKYPISDMKLLDSFFMPGFKPHQISGSLKSFRERGWVFTARTVTENGVKGVRLWRIA